MFRHLKDESGATLVMVMLILLIITILGAGLLTSAIMENKIVYSQEDQKQAFYLAQAGVEYARYQLQQDLTWRIQDYTANLGEGSFTLDVLGDGENQLKICSTGNVGRRSKQLEVGVYYTLPGGGGVIEELAQYTALGGGDISFKNSATIDGNGNLRTNGNIIFQNKGYVDGELISSGQVSGYVDSGGITESADSYQMPTIEWDLLKQEALADGRYYTGWNDNLLDDAVNYIDGTVSRKKLVLALDGILVIRGNLDVKNAARIISNNGLMIFVDGNVTFQNKLVLNAAIYATGYIKIQNQANITGAIYSEKWIECKNNIHLTLEASHLQQTTVESFVTENESGNPSDDKEKSMSLTYWKEI